MNDQTLSVIDRLRIFEVRGQAGMLDSDLAALYGAQTKTFNKEVRRNVARFPKDFLFQLTTPELEILRFQFGTSSAHAGRRYLPWVSTEHGAIMAVTTLNSPRAVAMSVYVVRAFVRMRRELLADTVLEKRLTQIEKTLLANDVALREVLEKVRPLLLPSVESPKRRTGFRPEPD